MRKNFNDIDIFSGIKSSDGAKWQKDNNITPDWRTPEHIMVKPAYTKEDLLQFRRKQGGWRLILM